MKRMAAILSALAIATCTLCASPVSASHKADTPADLAGIYYRMRAHVQQCMTMLPSFLPTYRSLRGKQTPLPYYIKTYNVTVAWSVERRNAWHVAKRVAAACKQDWRLAPRAGTTQTVYSSDNTPEGNDLYRLQVAVYGWEGSVGVSFDYLANDSPPKPEDRTLVDISAALNLAQKTWPYAQATTRRLRIQIKAFEHQWHLKP